MMIWAKTFPTGRITREFYQISLSINTTGISLYIMGIEDKIYLTQTCEKNRKVTVSGYCIKFKMLKDINLYAPEAVIWYKVE